MPVYVVRHAHAGSRRAWTGDDTDRPLSDRGRRQADHLAGLLTGEPVGEVLSSSARRCIETVTPVARAHDLEVRTKPWLFEGTDADRVLRELLERADHNPVLCSHGDIIPKLIRMLVAAGMDADNGSESRKGSMWVLEVRDGDVVEGRYHLPGA